MARLGARHPDGLVPGHGGGHALADLLLGKANPSGKLPCVFPRSEAQLPFFDRNADRIEYGLLHGYRLMDHSGEVPAFPFGFGLSYTAFRYGSLTLDCEAMGPGGKIRVSVEVGNCGAAAGDEVVQCYVGCDGSSASSVR